MSLEQTHPSLVTPPLDTARPRTRPWLGRAAIFAAVAALVFGGIASLNWRLDPLTYDGREQAALADTLVSGHNAAIADPNIDWRALRSRHIAAMAQTPDVVLFGGSRWQEATAAAVGPDKRFYNAFVTNDFFEDIVALTQLLDSTHHLPKTLILSVRFFSFSYLDRHDPFWWTWLSPDYRAASERLGVPAHSWSESVTFAKYSRLLSAETALAKARATSGPVWQPTDRLSEDGRHVVGADGALRFSQQHLRSLTPESVERDALETAAEHRARRIQIDRSLVGQLGTLVGFLKRQGVQVVLVQTPFHPAYYRAIRGTPYHADLLRIEADTRRIAASIEMPDSTQISIRSNASGQARLIECWRLPMRFEIKIFGA